jgi:hypothetical protein
VLSTLARAILQYRHSGAAPVPRRGNPTAEQDAGANIGAADGPKGELQDAASQSIVLFTAKSNMD